MMIVMIVEANNQRLSPENHI